jgi:hypothetical protein
MSSAGDTQPARDPRHVLLALGVDAYAAVEAQHWAEPLAARVASEVWRLKRRVHLAEGSTDEETLRIVFDSISRLEDILLENHIEIREHEGEQYDPGLQVEVLHMRDGSTPLFILETVRPTVTMDGRILQQAQVVIGPTEPKETD